MKVSIVNEDNVEKIMNYIVIVLNKNVGSVKNWTQYPTKNEAIAWLVRNYPAENNEGLFVVLEVEP